LDVFDTPGNGLLPSRVHHEASWVHVGRAAPESGRRRRPWFSRWQVPILAFAVVLAYSRIFSAGFVAFDDDFQVYANPFLNPPTLTSVARFWEHAYKQLYIPLAYSILAGVAFFARVPVHVDTSIGESISLDPTAFHVASVWLGFPNCAG
jgi:hypothetical protein